MGNKAGFVSPVCHHAWPKKQQHKKTNKGEVAIWNYRTRSVVNVGGLGWDIDVAWFVFLLLLFRGKLLTDTGKPIDLAKTKLLLGKIDSIFSGQKLHYILLRSETAIAVFVPSPHCH
jgi:hypothetical protein